MTDRAGSFPLLAVVLGEEPLVSLLRVVGGKVGRDQKELIRIVIK